MAAGTRRAALALTLLASAAPAVPAGAASPPALAGTTVVTGSRPGVVAVRLARAVTFDVYANVRIAGRGRLVGFVLKQDGPWNAASAHSFQTGFCARPGCAPAFEQDKTGGVWAPGSSTGYQGKLPAGNYRLWLVTDGAPVTVTLRFPGLPGRTTVRPASAPRVALVTPTPTAAQPPGAPLSFAGGSTRTVPARGGLNFTVVWKDHPVAEATSAVGSCHYDGPPPAANQPWPAFQTPCQDGAGGFPPFVAKAHQVTPGPTPVGPGRFVSYFITGYLLPPGQVSLGGYHNTAGPVTTAALQQLWIDY